MCAYIVPSSTPLESLKFERFAEWTSSSFAYLNHPRDERKKRRKLFFYFFFIFSCCCHVVWAMGQSRISAYIRPLDCIVHRRRLTFLLKISAAARELFFLFLYFFFKSVQFRCVDSIVLLCPTTTDYIARKKNVFLFFFVNVYITRTSASSEKCN